MAINENQRAYFLKTIFFSLLQAALLTGLYLLTEVVLKHEIQMAFWLFWFPAFGSVVFWILIYGNSILNTNYIVQFLAVFIFAFPSSALYLVMYDLSMHVEEAATADHLDISKKHTVWKVGNLRFGDRFTDTFESVSAGKNPLRYFEAVVVSKIEGKHKNLWIYTSTTSSIPNRKAENKIAECRFDNNEKNLQKEYIRFTNRKYPVYLIPLEENAESRNARELLKQFKLKSADEASFYDWSRSFTPGVHQSSFWLLAGSVGACLIFFFILSFSASRADGTSGLLGDLLGFTASRPMTTLLMLYAFIIFIISLTLEPNIMEVRNDSKLVDLAVWKDVKGQWYRIFTAPFVDFFLLYRVFGILILFAASTIIEKFTSKTGFIILTLGAIASTGLASMYFSETACYGPHAIYICFAAWYASKAIFFRKAAEMEGGVLALVFVLVFLVASLVPGFLDFPRIAAAIAAGLALSLVTGVRKSKSLNSF